MPAFIVKVCGLTTREDAQAALDAGANALGFNFYAKSPRYISFDHAMDMITGLSGEFVPAGIFVHPTDEELLAASRFLAVAQVHGSHKLPLAAPLPIWRAMTAGTTPARDPNVEAYLLDSPTPGYGGSGKTFDWSLAAGFPYRVILAGGLDGDNVSEAIRIANPWGVDACSRIEASPGKKDQRRMAAFVENALSALHARQAVHI